MTTAIRTESTTVTQSTHIVTEANLRAHRRAVIRGGGAIVLSSPIGGNRYSVTVRFGSAPRIPEAVGNGTCDHCGTVNTLVHRFANEVYRCVEAC